MDLIKTARGAVINPESIACLCPISVGFLQEGGFFKLWFRGGTEIIFSRPKDNSYGYDYLEGMTLEEMHDHIEEAMRRAKGGDHHHDGPRR